MKAVTEKQLEGEDPWEWELTGSRMRAIIYHFTAPRVRLIFGKKISRHIKTLKTINGHF